MTDAIRAFLGVDRPATEPATLLRAVLFTDIVGSTEHLSRVGDRTWRELLVIHDERAAKVVESHRGRVVKSTGDGVLATFEGQPKRCERQRPRGGGPGSDVEVRAGVHVGEIETKGDDVTGVAVHIAARVAALAGTSQVLVSQTVRDLVAGPVSRSRNAGEHELKGVPDRWHLYRVTG